MTSEAVEPVLAGVRNFRDLGGLPTTDGRRVRQGMLFRSGHLARATDQDAAFLTRLGLHTVYDFRNDADIALDGTDVALPGVRNVNMPLTDPAHGVEFWKLVRDGEVAVLREELADGRAVARMQESYADIVRTRTAEHGRVLRELAEGSVPVLMHCAAGKDRAGLSVAITLLALGVEQEAIEADYLLSNAPHRRYEVHRGDGALEAEDRKGIDPEVRELLAPFFDARPVYLATAYATIADVWGDVDTYLSRGLGLTDPLRGALRDRFLA
ncbi:tyrosine-protein phosphatase [Streptomyces sp. JJ66]|uniref:tyrosine-protein phosphatase n=1 Tax=Streptomyces sp. JJ66 TaxID=2803843 RepID=UPI001C588933|nr:tyrosine-protein phosphatase [Streptomyces sp. JJ66]MBW1601991.1 tyrosine-protein phosphatase [Streptomyces sp. JJ66]